MIALPRTKKAKNRANNPGNQEWLEALDKLRMFMKVSTAWHNGSLEEHPDMLEEVPLDMMNELAIFVHYDNPKERLQYKNRREEGIPLVRRGFSG